MFTAGLKLIRFLAGLDARCPYMTCQGSMRSYLRTTLTSQSSLSAHLIGLLAMLPLIFFLFHTVFISCDINALLYINNCAKIKMRAHFADRNKPRTTITGDTNTRRELAVKKNKDPKYKN